MRALFVDANDTLAAVTDKLLRTQDLPVAINRNPSIKPDDLPSLLDGVEIMIVDHTAVPTATAAKCAKLKHVVFLGTGARSYMNPEELAERGIAVHTIKGYGDTARMAAGCGMKVIAWNRSPKTHPGVEFVSLEKLLADSDVISLHLLLNDETKGFLSRERIGMMRPGSILINTARGAVVDEDAMLEALRSGHIAHAGLDVFTVEPLPSGHPLTKLPNVTLSAHSAFRTPEASDNLIGAALDHCRRIIATGK